jgi:hypothetical protein
MHTLFLVLTIVTMLAVLAVLFVGLVGMAQNGPFNRKHGNKVMQLRVWLQALAIVFFVLALATG